MSDKDAMEVSAVADPVVILDQARRRHGDGDAAGAVPLLRAVVPHAVPGAPRALVLLWLATALSDAGWPEDAVTACREAIDSDRENAVPYATLAGLLLDLGRLDEAAATVADALERGPTDIGTLNLATGIALARGQAAEARELAGAVLAVDSTDQRALSHLVLALTELGENAAAETLLDFGRLLRVQEMPLAPGSDDRASFDQAIAESIAARTDLDREPLRRTLVGGARLHDTFLLEPPLAAALRQGFAEAIAGYRAGLTVAAEHPVRRGDPGPCRIESWANLMVAANYESAHIHDGSWLSGVYYPELPAVAADDEPDAGAIEFGGHDFGTALRKKGAVHRIQPVPGLLVLFPSYFYHRTLPFRAGGRRISVAFVAKRIRV
ncbi:MAG: putative 2OG-Fe(II) oxygenase [Aliidongia sp.]